MIIGLVKRDLCDVTVKRANDFLPLQDSHSKLEWPGEYILSSEVP